MQEQIEDKNEQIHTLKARLNERDKRLISANNNVDRMKEEFAPTHVLEESISRLKYRPLFFIFEFYI